MVFIRVLCFILFKTTATTTTTATATSMFRALKKLTSLFQASSLRPNLLGDALPGNQLLLLPEARVTGSDED